MKPLTLSADMLGLRLLGIEPETVIEYKRAEHRLGVVFDAQRIYEYDAFRELHHRVLGLYFVPSIEELLAQDAMGGPTVGQRLARLCGEDSQ